VLKTATTFTEKAQTDNSIILSISGERLKIYNINKSTRKRFLPNDWFFPQRKCLFIRTHQYKRVVIVNIAMSSTSHKVVKCLSTIKVICHNGISTLNYAQYKYSEFQRWLTGYTRLIVKQQGHICSISLPIWFTWKTTFLTLNVRILWHQKCTLINLGLRFVVSLKVNFVVGFQTGQ